jgi:hypothetical protein
MKQFTIRFETESVEAAKDIFKSIKTGNVVNGIRVTAITYGDLFKRLNFTEEQLDLYIEHIPYTLDNETQKRFDELQNAIDETWGMKL